MANTMPMMQIEHFRASCVDDPADISVSGKGGVNLSDLPDEILLQIIGRVGWGGLSFGARDVFNLALCSRRFYQLAEPELYSEIRQKSSSSPNSCRDFLQFLARIFARRDLARSVRRLSCCITYSSDEGNGLSPADFQLTGGGGELTQFRNIVKETYRSDEESGRWVQSLEIGQWAAVISLFLSVTPNLEELEITEWSSNDCSNGAYECIFEAFERARTLQDSGVESQISMSKLRSIEVSFWDEENGYAFDEVVPFLKLKSVQTFWGHMVSQDNGPSVMDPTSQLKLTTKELKLTHSVISHYDMIAILRNFPELERFCYEFGGAAVGDADFRPPRMIAALEHLKSCLKELTLTSDECYGESYEETCPIGSLAGFQSLESITANAFVMIGENRSDEEEVLDDDDDSEGAGGGFPKTQDLVDAVPPSLKSLSLRDCNEHVVGHIFELVSQKRWRTPQFRKLDLEWKAVESSDEDCPGAPILHPGFTEEEAQRLMAECQAAGIEIVIED
ncbi:unnamed protein product [Calypogeia fissa]